MNPKWSTMFFEIAGRMFEISIHPGKSTWNQNMEVWKMLFLFQLGDV